MDGQVFRKDRERVFIPFARLDDSRTRSTGGRWPGLSICICIAFWFNGKMKVDESPSLGGARFVMTWPVRPLVCGAALDELTQKSTEEKYVPPMDKE